MRERRRSRQTSNKAQDGNLTPPYIKRTIPTYNLLSDADLEIIEHNADTILEEIGIVFADDDEACDIFSKAGASVEGNRVRFPRGMCREIVQKTAKKEFIQHARNPKRSVTIGGDNLVLAPAYGPPFVRDLEGKRRYASIEDFRNFVKLAYSSPNLHHSGGTVCEPVDLPVNKRHFDMVYSHLKYSDKPFMGSVTSGDRAEDTVEMAKIVFGEDFFSKNCVILNLINASSPMAFDKTMLDAMKVYARNQQGVIITPFIVAGAMAPVTIAGVVAQSLAEGLAGMSLVQLISPGSPMVYGNFVTAMSMQTGAPTFGMPEALQMMNVSGAIARRLGVPFRSGGGFTASKITDAQAGYESANTMQATLLAGVNFNLHTAGWLEGGLAMGYEKFMMDDDQAGMIRVAARAVAMDENAQALSAIAEVGPQSHFLGCKHTEENFRSAFYISSLADNNSFEQWKEDGERDMSFRANKLCQERLDAYEAPELDSEIDAKLLAFMKERKESFPDSNVS